jgi:quercetin dioxygenase-like cupin family protein
MKEVVQTHKGGHRWEGVDVHPYKETGSHFRSITRQTLFPGGHDLPVELRYFEVLEGGHSTLERHDHAHLVMIIRGSGQVLVGEDIQDVALFDVVQVPPQTWHQFRANRADHLGFACIVAQDRDKPHRPDEQEREELLGNVKIGDFVRF